MQFLTCPKVMNSELEILLTLLCTQNVTAGLNTGAEQEQAINTAPVLVCVRESLK